MTTLGVCVLLVGEWSPVFARQRREAGIRHAHQPFRSVENKSHIDEHTIQIDKTLDWLGYQPTEPARIARALLAAWGRLEARIFPVPPAGTEAAVSEILERMAAELTADARSVREAAGV